MFVGAKHDRSQYGIITNNLYAVMLRPFQKWDAPQETIGLKPLPDREKVKENYSLLQASSL